jgi:hypothetical protein
MHETPEDIAELQRKLDESYGVAGEHYRSLFGAERCSSAVDVVAQLGGVFMINLATVTAECEPIVSPLDGLFYRGRLWISLPPGSQRARHLRARPRASATYAAGDDGPCLVVHGVARMLEPSSPWFEGFDRYAREVYGDFAVEFAKQRNASRTEPDFTGFIEPRRIYAHDFPKVR